MAGNAIQIEKRQVLGMLGLLENTPLLAELATDLQIPGLDLENTADDGPQLYILITTYLLSAEFTELDRALELLQTMKDKLKTGLGIPPEADPEMAMRGVLRGDGRRGGPPGGGGGGGLAGFEEDGFMEPPPNELPPNRHQVNRNLDRDSDPSGEEENEEDSENQSVKSEESSDGEHDRDRNERDREDRDAFQGVIDNMDRRRREQEKARRDLRRATHAAQAAGLRVNEIGRDIGADGGVGKFRQLKLDGTVGKPGEKKKLTYRGLLSQIKSAVAQGFSDSEIVSAVKKCVPCGSSLRNFFDERDNLTVKRMLPTLEAYFQQKNATTLYNELTGAVMSGDDSELSFAMDLMALRDTIYKVSRSEGGGYSRELLQSQFQKALYTGIKNERVREELRPLLMKKLKGKGKKKRAPSDTKIIQEITHICMIDLEHQAKIESKTKRANVSAVAAKGPDVEDKSTKVLDPIVEQFKAIVQPLTTSVCQLNSAVEKLNTQNQKFPLTHPNDSQLKQAALQQLQHAQFVQQQEHLLKQANLQKQKQQQPPNPQQDPQKPPLPQDDEKAKLYRLYNPDDDLYNIPVDLNSLNWGNPGSFPYAMGFGNNFGYGFSGRGGRGGFGRGRGGSNGGRGRGRGGRSNNNQPSLCPACTLANAIFCNHCKICYRIDHRTTDCDHKGDPNFVPKNQ